MAYRDEFDQNKIRADSFSASFDKGSEQANRAEIEKLKELAKEAYGDENALQTRVKDDGSIEVNLAVKDPLERDKAEIARDQNEFDPSARESVEANALERDVAPDLDVASDRDSLEPLEARDTAEIARDQNEYDPSAQTLERDVAPDLDVASERDSLELLEARDTAEIARDQNEFDPSAREGVEANALERDVSPDLDVASDRDSLEPLEARDTAEIARDQNEYDPSAQTLERDVTPDFDSEYAKLEAEVAALRQEAFASRDPALNLERSDERIIDLNENAIQLDGRDNDTRVNAQNDSALQLQESIDLDRTASDRGLPIYHGTDIEAELERVNARIEAASRSGEPSGVALDGADAGVDKNPNNNVADLYHKLFDLEDEARNDGKSNNNFDLNGAQKPSDGFSLQKVLDKVNESITDLQGRMNIDYSLDNRSRGTSFSRG